MIMDRTSYYIPDFSFLLGARGVLYLGAMGASVLDHASLPLVSELHKLRGGMVSGGDLLERLKARRNEGGEESADLHDKDRLAESLGALIDKGLLVEKTRGSTAFERVVLQFDDEDQAAQLAESLAPLGLNLSVVHLDDELPQHAASTLLVTFQQTYRPGLIARRRSLPANFFQLNSYSLGNTWYLDPLYSQALGTPCHQCFLGRLAHVHASSARQDGSDWFLFECMLDEFKQVSESKRLTASERGLANFHLFRVIRSFVGAFAPRLRSEDMQSTLAVSLLDGRATWQPLAHWDMCDCIQLETGGSPAGGQMQ